MKVGFYLFSDFHSNPDAASSRIRGQWLINHWPEAERINYAVKYDAIIYQKVYEVRHARVYQGIKILDVCDPDWLHYKEPFIEMVEECDAVTVPTEVLRRTVQGWTKKPVIVIPDRHDLDYFKEEKIHRGRAKEVCWFGYSQNHSVLKAARKCLIENELAISLISDKPIILSECELGINLNERFTAWNLETVNKEIIKSDFVIMPGSRNPNHRFKSNNKIVHSWLLKMPVANCIEDLERFIDPAERQKEADKNYEIAIRDYDVRSSVKEMQELIEKLRKEKK